MKKKSVIHNFCLFKCPFAQRLMGKYAKYYNTKHYKTQSKILYKFSKGTDQQKQQVSVLFYAFKVNCKVKNCLT